MKGDREASIATFSTIPHLLITLLSILNAKPTF
jgi:hypothetical protein